MTKVRLVLAWIIMGLTLVFDSSGIEDLKSFSIIYAMLSIFLGYALWHDKKCTDGGKIL